VIDSRVLAVFTALEERDAHERDTGADRSVRLRQVTPEVGRLLHTLVIAARPRDILEIGTSGGYSTLWIASAARAIGSVVTSLEIDPAKVELARQSIEDAGLSDVARVVQGDAFAFLRTRSEPIGFCFLDAEKEDYPAFYDLVVPLLVPGGVLVADNILSHAEELAAFTSHVLGDERMSAVVVPVGRGELLAARLP
jgi:predicted O-methyltransferase YrrM